MFITFEHCKNNLKLFIITIGGIILTNSNAQSNPNNQSWLSQTIPQKYYQQTAPNNRSFPPTNNSNNNQNYDNYDVFTLTPDNYNGKDSVNGYSSLSGVPANEQSLINWVVSSGDNYGRSFLIANKRSGEIILVEGDGSISARSPALFGARLGDEMVSKQTPAGAYTLFQVAAENPGYGGDVLVFANDDVNKVSISVHRVWLETPSERRLQRLSSPNPKERRISDGCINLPDSFYENIVGIVNGSKIYILPETRAYF